MGMPSRRTNNFPESGRDLGHVTPTIFGSTVGYPSDSLASCCMIHPCDRRADGQTDGRYIIRAIAYMLSRVKTGLYQRSHLCVHCFVRLSLMTYILLLNGTS